MSSLLELSYDLINKAKLAQNSQQKLFNLEQVKEIIFYRDKTLINQVIPELFELMLERSVAIRKFLVKVAGDALKHSISLASATLPLFSFLIVDGNDKVLQSIAFELANCYDKISIFVATLPMKSMNISGKSQDNEHDSRDLWHQLRSMTIVLVETIASNRSDSLRIQSIKLCENIVLFGLPPTNAPTIKDPRMAKFASGRTLLDIPSNHQFIDRNDVEKEADGILSRLVLWARRGGPQGFPFSQTALSQLGHTIGVIAAERLSVFRKTIPALLFLIQGNDSISPVYNNPVARQQLTFLLARIIKAATGQPDPDGLLKKLQETLTALDKLNPVSAAVPAVITARDLSSLDPRKRKLEEKAIAAAMLAAQTEAASKEQKEGEENPPEDEDYRDDEDGDLAIDEESIRASALAALDAAESQIQTDNAPKRIRIEDLVPVTTSVLTPESPKSPKSPMAQAPTFVPPPTLINEYSTLASDIGAFPSDASTSMRLVSISSTPIMSSYSDKSTTSMFQSVGPPCEVFSDLAMGSLSKILQNTLVSTTSLRLKSLLHLQLLLRTTFAMAQKDNILSASAGINNANSNSLSISILKTEVPSERIFHNPKLKPLRIPMEVNLPRSIWLYISHCLQAHEGESNASYSYTVGTIYSINESNLTNDLTKKFDRLDLILALIREIYVCSHALEEGKILGIPCSYVPLRYNDDDDDDEEGNNENENTDMNIQNSAALINESNSLLQIGDDDLDPDSPSCSLYDSICLIMLTRLIQRRVLRPFTMRILLSIPTIPLVCLQLLGLLLLTGTKQIVTNNPGSGRRKGPAANDRGTRIVSLDIMGGLLLHEPCMTGPESFMSVLFPLLWSATSEDFSTRSSAVNVLVSATGRIDRDYEQGHALSHVKTTILLFAQQLALNVVGINCFIERTKLRNINWERFDDNLSSPRDVMRFLCDLDFEDNVTLITALRSFDDGKLFGRSFDSLSSIPSHVSNIESYAKRCLHLLVQLTLTRPHLLISFLDLYATITAIESCQIHKAPPSNSFEEQVTLLPQHSGHIIRKIIRNEVLNIIPAITTSAKATDSVFETLLQSESLSLPLLISVLDIILDDPQIPPSEHMVQMVTSYFDKLPTENQDVRLLIPMLGGMTKEKLQQTLPLLILKLQDDNDDNDTPSSSSTSTAASASSGAASVTSIEINDKDNKIKKRTKYDYLKQSFIRITQARPPPLSRSHLLVLLHRINYEQYKIPLKLLVETITLCLASKEEFNSDVIKDAINIILTDTTEPLPIVLMRTVILSSQSLPEIKKYALNVVIPTLIQRKVWITSPTIWDGIAHAVKAMISSRDSELTLKSLLSLPLTQLKNVLKIATNILGQLAKLIKTLSNEELNEVLSGRWANIEIENYENQREEKLKLVEEILSTSAGTTTSK